jgi:hypothetical protein
LEVSEKLIAVPITQPHSRDALIDLTEDVCTRQATTRAEAAVVAKRAPAFGHGAIDIRTCEAGVEAYFLNALPEALAKKKTARVIREPGILPWQEQ